MGCFHPLEAYKSIKPKDNGKHHIAFKKPTDRHLYQLIGLPCSQCIGCRLERSRQWAIRCLHEASLHTENSFITLTYNNDNYPSDGSLDVREFQLFMKKLRNSTNKKIRYFHCGEYGDNLGRPHFHACLFGYDFDDKVFHNEKNGQKYYISNTLNNLWGKGYCIIGSVTFQSSAYVARYIMKKINGDDKEKHYETINELTGEIYQLTQEYTTMSRRPGIGADWLKKYKSDVYPADEVIINGHQVRPPKFYDNQYELTDPSEHTLLKDKRNEKALHLKKDNTPERLAVKKTVLHSKIKQLKRELHS